MILRLAICFPQLELSASKNRKFWLFWILRRFAWNPRTSATFHLPSKVTRLLPGLLCKSCEPSAFGHFPQWVRSARHGSTRSFFVPIHFSEQQAPVRRMMVRVQSSKSILSDSFGMSRVVGAVRQWIAKEIGLPSKNFQLGKWPRGTVLMRDDLKMNRFASSLDLKVRIAGQFSFVRKLWGMFRIISIFDDKRGDRYEFGRVKSKYIVLCVIDHRSIWAFVPGWLAG
jgi:hypothetical protein